MACVGDELCTLSDVAGEPVKACATTLVATTTIKTHGSVWLGPRKWGVHKQSEYIDMSN